MYFILTQSQQRQFYQQICYADMSQPPPSKQNFVPPSQSTPISMYQINLIHFMQAIAHAHATSLMHVKNSMCHFSLLTLIVWDTGMMKINEQKHD